MSGQLESTESAHKTVLKMITGGWVAQILRTAADLSLAEHLADRARTADDIARLEGADPDGTFRLMRACVSIGLLEYSGKAFVATPLLDVLREGAPESLKYFALSQTAPGLWLTWGRTTSAVRQGSGQASAALGSGLFEYFAGHTEEAALFGAAMTDLSWPVIRQAVAVIDVPTGAAVVDVGGANGAFVLELLERHQGASGLIFDLPHASSGALEAAKARQLEDRVVVVSGDFFREVAEGDLLLLKYVLHSWDDEQSVKVLRNCRTALRPGGRVALLEIVLNDRPAGIAPLMDIAMLTMLGSRERTLAEFDHLLSRAGLRRVRTTSLDESHTLIEAVVA
jgi:SAM-dependent methyltransferase